jgi:hypothetical protein
MFKCISKPVTTRQGILEKKNSHQELLNVVITKFLKDIIGPTSARLTFHASLECGNLYISTPHKSLANEIVFKAKPLYAALKQHRIACNNLIIR